VAARNGHLDVVRYLVHEAKVEAHAPNKVSIYFSRSIYRPPIHPLFKVKIFFRSLNLFLDCFCSIFVGSCFADPLHFTSGGEGANGCRYGKWPQRNRGIA